MKIETITSEPETPGQFSITKISPAIKNANRVNIYLNDKFYCSLDIAQLVDLKLKIGQNLSNSELENLKKLSDFGKLYTRALEYALLRPHSEKEIHDYLIRKTKDRLVRVKDHGLPSCAPSQEAGAGPTFRYKTIKKPGYDSSLVAPVMHRLLERGFIDDEKFARTWVENRNTTKGISKRRLEQELYKKGIKKPLIDQVLSETTRNDSSEIAKIIAKKAQKYANDPQKLIQYLVRQGFDYDSAKTAVHEMDSQSSA